MSLSVQSAATSLPIGLTPSTDKTGSLARSASSASSLLGSSAQSPGNALQMLSVIFNAMLSLIASFASYLFKAAASQSGTQTPTTTTPSSSSGTGGSDTTGTTDSSSTTTTTQTPSEQVATLANLKVTDGGSGKFSVKTPDGYTVATEGKEQAWYITDPQGRKTRISGDLKLLESDGDTLTLKGQSTLKFGKNKVTVEVVGGKSAKITVYNGKERVTFAGINTDQPVVDGAGQDARSDDHKRLDKDVYLLGKEKNGEDRWHLVK